MKSNVEVKVENGIQELVIREGMAAPIVEPLKVTLKGTISAPRLFIAKRRTQADVLSSNVVFDPNKGTITLTMNEKDAKGTIVEGVLKMNPDLLEFKINTDNRMGLKEIQRFLRMRRSFFKDREQNETLLKKLSEFYAKITIEINKKDDRKGNTLDSIQSQVSHDIPLLFTLAIPVYQGFGVKEFVVEIVGEITDANVSFTLESVELQELIDRDKKNILEAELKSLEDYVTIEV